MTQIRGLSTGRPNKIQVHHTGEIYIYIYVNVHEKNNLVVKWSSPVSPVISGHQPCTWRSEEHAHGDLTKICLKMVRIMFRAKIISNCRYLSSGLLLPPRPAHGPRAEKGWCRRCRQIRPETGYNGWRGITWWRMYYEYIRIKLSLALQPDLL